MIEPGDLAIDPKTRCGDVVVEVFGNDPQGGYRITGAEISVAELADAIRQITQEANRSVTQ